MKDRKWGGSAAIGTHPRLAPKSRALTWATSRSRSMMNQLVFFSADKQRKKTKPRFDPE